MGKAAVISMPVVMEQIYGMIPDEGGIDFPTIKEKMRFGHATIALALKGLRVAGRVEQIMGGLRGRRLYRRLPHDDLSVLIRRGSVASLPASAGPRFVAAEPIAPYGSLAVKTYRKPIVRDSHDLLRRKIWRWWADGKLNTVEMAKAADVPEPQIERELHSVLAKRVAVRNSVGRSS